MTGTAPAGADAEPQGRRVGLAAAGDRERLDGEVLTRGDPAMVPVWGSPRGTEALRSLPVSPPVSRAPDGGRRIARRPPEGIGSAPSVCADAASRVAGAIPDTMERKREHAR